MKNIISCLFNKNSRASQRLEKNEKSIRVKTPNKRFSSSLPSPKSSDFSTDAKRASKQDSKQETTQTPVSVASQFKPSKTQCLIIKTRAEELLKLVTEGNHRPTVKSKSKLPLVTHAKTYGRCIEEALALDNKEAFKTAVENVINKTQQTLAGLSKEELIGSVLFAFEHSFNTWYDGGKTENIVTILKPRQFFANKDASNTPRAMAIAVKNILFDMYDNATQSPLSSATTSRNTSVSQAISSSSEELTADDQTETSSIDRLNSLQSSPTASPVRDNKSQTTSNSLVEAVNTNLVDTTLEETVRAFWPKPLTYQIDVVHDVEHIVPVKHSAIRTAVNHFDVEHSAVLTLTEEELASKNCKHTRLSGLTFDEEVRNTQQDELASALDAIDQAVGYVGNSNTSEDWKKLLDDDDVSQHPNRPNRFDTILVKVRNLMGHHGIQNIFVTDKAREDFYGKMWDVALKIEAAIIMNSVDGEFFEQYCESQKIDTSVFTTAQKQSINQEVKKAFAQLEDEYLRAIFTKQNLSSSLADEFDIEALSEKIRSHGETSLRIVTKKFRKAQFSKDTKDNVVVQGDFV